MVLCREEDMPAEAEPFTLDGLDNYLLREAVVERLLAGQDEAHIGAVLRAQGCLPEGQFATLALRGPAEEGASLAKALLPLLAGHAAAGAASFCPPQAASVNASTPAEKVLNKADACMLEYSLVVNKSRPNNPRRHRENHRLSSLWEMNVPTP